MGATRRRKARQPALTQQRRGWVAYLLPFLLGAALRLHALRGQVLLDDEWHALDFVIGKPLTGVLFNQGLGANSVPLNVWAALLLHTVGWSEWLLRLPSVLCGLASLVALPVLASRVWRPSIGVAFAWLLAVAPCPIFYERLFRPYAMVLLFGTISILGLFLWMKERRRHQLLLWAVPGFLAVYAHLYAAIFVVTPFACVAVFERRRLNPLMVPALVFAALVVIFLVPPSLANPWWVGGSSFGKDGVTADSFSGLLELLGGTGFWPVNAVQLALCGFGFCRLARDDRRKGVAVGAAVGVYFAAVAASSQEMIHVAIMLARYGIILFPLSGLLAALGLDALGSRWAQRAAAAWAVLLLILGPLAATSAGPNNFMNHAVFQDSYQARDWVTSGTVELAAGFELTARDAPAFYRELGARSDVPGVIEYPFFVGDSYDFEPYYQHLHGKPVAMGFVLGLAFDRLPSNDDWIYASTTPDYVLGRVPVDARSRLRFGNLVDLTDLASIAAAREGWAIVVHKCQGQTRRYAPVDALLARLRLEFGAPLAEDRLATVFLIKR